MGIQDMIGKTDDDIYKPSANREKDHQSEKMLSEKLFIREESITADIWRSNYGYRLSKFH